MGTSGHDRGLSHWGWGVADRFPRREEREDLGRGLVDVLGFAPTTLDEPVPLHDLRPPSGRVTPPGALAALVTDDDEARIRHTHGRAYPDIVNGFRGRFEHPPDLVGFPTDEEDVRRLLDWAAETDVVVVPYGGGTSVVGGVRCDLAGDDRAVLSLDLRGLDRVVEVDDVSLTARIQAGALGPDLESGLAAHGLTLRHYPQSFEHSTLGGWLATRAGGHFATLWTHIDDLTVAIRALSPSGIWSSRSVPGSGAGPGPDRLLLGSEGTLGVITEAVMRVRRRPRFRSRAAVRFDRFDHGVAACRALAQADLHPANARLLDPTEAAFAGVARDGATVLLLAFESADGPREEWMRQALALTADHGGECPDGEEHTVEALRHGGRGGRRRGGRRQDPGAGHVGEVQESGAGASATWRRAFLDAPYLLNSLVSLGVLVDTFETACTWADFPDLHARVMGAATEVLERVCGAGRVSCRFTHLYPQGPAPYYTALAPTRPGDEIAVWREIKTAVTDAIVEAGGTVTHHHAVGRTHLPWYRRQRPERFAAALRAARSAVDPTGILNPGLLD